jgi:hypothetical protein
MTDVPEDIAECMRKCPYFLDYPTAWAIQKDRGLKLTHHERCSSVPGWDPISGPAFLCDCGAVEDEYKRLVAAAPLSRHPERNENE